MTAICKMLRNTLCASALMLVAMGLGSMPAAVAQEVVKVGSTLDLAPFEYVDPDGNPQGFEIDILAVVAEKLGVKFEFVKTPFSQAFTGLAAGKYRFNASAIFILCERLNNQHGEFTVPNYTENQAVSARTDDADNIKSLDDLKGLRVGVESKGSTSDGLADAYKDKIGFSKEIYPDTSALFLALEQKSHRCSRPVATGVAICDSQQAEHEGRIQRSGDDPSVRIHLRSRGPDAPAGRRSDQRDEDQRRAGRDLQEVVRRRSGSRRPDHQRGPQDHARDLLTGQDGVLARVDDIAP